MGMPAGNSDITTNDGSSSGGGGDDDKFKATSFQKPLFLTFGMFVATSFGLLLHLLVLVCQIPYPGYDFEASRHEVDGKLGTETITLLDTSLSNGHGPTRNDDNGSITRVDKRKNIPRWMYFYLAIPAIFDFAATLLL